jgi:MFS family permease
MPEDIGASAQQFSTAVSIFYATYVTFETPSAILLKKLTPRVLLTSLCIVWSLTTIFSGFIHNVAGLYASRLVLGACEAGLFPSLTLYLTMVYRREEQAKRVAYLFSCTALSGAFGGLLAYALLQMDGVAGTYNHETESGETSICRLVLRCMFMLTGSIGYAGWR